ncbi:MAG: hypothetical protein Q4F56_00730 [Candidatus Saccharibacteria bacterium]|nr:hypothetical protein [Candidatus Saccharibacteria bacterium]
MFVEWNIEDNLTRSLHWRHHCGGKPTYDAWKADGKPSDILIKLWHAPIHQMLVTEKGLILLSHAGYTPRQNCLRNLSDDDLLRGRKHFTDPWELGDRKIFVVHGHTPVELLPFEADPNKPAFYCEEHKVCIDLGTHRTNNCALLNLDDFSYKVIHV